MKKALYKCTTLLYFYIVKPQPSGDFPNPNVHKIAKIILKQMEPFVVVYTEITMAKKYKAVFFCLLQ